MSRAMSIKLVHGTKRSDESAAHGPSAQPSGLSLPIPHRFDVRDAALDTVLSKYTINLV